jgi:hypothetical protein
VSSPLSSRICTLTVSVLCASLLACHPKPDQQNTQSATEPTYPNDEKLVERAERMRAAALKAPGGAIEANNFASMVIMLYSQGVAKRRAVSPTIVDEAVESLELAKEAKPDEAPDLLARKGELLMEAGRSDAGVTALRASIDPRPTLRAFSRLAKHYKAQNKGAEIEALCKKTLPAMKSDESRYALLDECLKSSSAVTVESGLRWAPAKDIAFFKARRKELNDRLTAAKAQRAKEEKEKNH